MRDPHVVKLRYRVEPDIRVTFDSPDMVTAETDLFKIKLSEGILAFELKGHYASVEAAKAETNQFIRAWEIDVFLQYGMKELTFVYEDAEVIDRDPPPPGSPISGELTGTVALTMSASGTVHTVRRQYPRPPQHFRMSATIETLWHRYEGYLQGREPLLSMAYFCLTLIEAQTGGRSQAATAYQIDHKLLRKLGELTSRKGDAKTARKVNKDSGLIPLSPEEMAWVDGAVRTIIRQVGEHH